MAHFQQQRFVGAVRDHFPTYFRGTKVLEVGSWIVNGTVRYFFQSCDYLGVDVSAGPGVDLIAGGEQLDFPSGSFDVAISCECFEHNPFWRETFLNMSRMLRPGGLLVMSCAGLGRGEHGTQRKKPGASLTALEERQDYYRNLSRRDFERAFVLDQHFSHYAFYDNHYAKDLYFIGISREASPEPGLAEKLAALRRTVGAISLPEAPSLPRAMGKHLEWWAKRSLSRLFGEQRYHDLSHLVRSKVRRQRRRLT